MASFGRYETVRELYRSGYTIVYSGREADQTEEKFAIKVYQPSSLLFEEGQTKTDPHLFLNSAGVQQKVAAGGAQHWAPIYEYGSAPDGAFYVTDKCDRSLQQLIDGRVRLAAKDLHTIIESVAEGLLEFKQACNRPHGNLKSTNVLISGSRILLSDPLPDRYIDHEAHYDVDFRLIAEMIYQLVMHRPSPAVEGWQVPDSGEWGRLGRRAADWRSLCSRLLNAHLKPGTMTVETLLEELAQLKEAKPIISARRLIAAGLAVIACAVVLIMLWPPPAPPEKSEWENLCNDYEYWVSDLRAALGERAKDGIQRKVRWGQDQYLVEILDKIELASYPYKVVLNEGKLHVREVRDHPEYAERKKTQQALQSVEGIKGFFDPNADAAWPLLVEIADAASSLEKRGWQKPAAYFALLAENVQPGPDRKIAENADAILELNRKGTLNRISSCLKDIAEYQKKLSDSGAPILVNFDDRYVDQEVAAGPGEPSEEAVSELQEKLGQIAELGRKLAGFVEADWPRVDKDLLQSDPDYQKLAPSTEGFQNWLRLAQSFRRIEDPREDVAEERKKAVNQTEWNLKILEAEPTTQIIARKLRTKLEEIEDRFSRMPEILENEGIFLVARDEQAVRKKLELWLEDFRTLSTDVDQEVSKLVPPPEWLAKAEGWQIAGSQAVHEAWVKRRDSILDESTKGKLRGGDRFALAKVRPKVEEIWDRLNRLSSLARTLDRDFGQTLPPAEHGINNLLLEDAHHRQRENVFRRIIGQFPEDAVPDINDRETFRPQWHQELTTFRRYREDLGTLLKAFYEVHRRFQVCYLLDDEPTAQSVGRFDELLNEIRNANVFTDVFAENSPINTTFALLEGRIARLKEIRQQSERAGLVNIADTAAQTEAVYAAWARLGELSNPPWPDSKEQLSTDRDIRGRLRKEFENIKTSDRTRGNFLLQKLFSSGLEREIVSIEKNSSDDKVLARFGTTADKLITDIKAAYPDNPEAALNELEELEVLAGALADFLTGAEWQDKENKIRMDLFTEQSPLYDDNRTTFAKDDFRQWLGKEKGVKRYVKLVSDPRRQYRQPERNIEAKVQDIKGLISQKVLPSKPDKAQEFSSQLTSLDRDLANILDIPSIEGNRARIDESMDTLGSLWKRLDDLEKAVKSVIKPEYCERLDRLDSGQVVFPAGSALNGFEPLIAKDIRTFEPLFIASWEEFRTSEPLRTVFFERTEGPDPENIGWPKYLRSNKDPSVILRFIPAGSGSPQPFYMATHEITNQQYRLFLEKSGAKALLRPKGWSRFIAQDNTQLVISASFDYPPCGVNWDEAKNAFMVADPNKDIPVTLVTYPGAQSYAGWLDAQLPTASQHAYAARAGANTLYPWGDNLSQVAGYAHVRAAAWQIAARQYNSKIDNPLEIAHAPVGAVKPNGFVAQQTPLDVTGVVYEQEAYGSPWPVAGASKPNAWGLYDMVGNVWEWCQDSRNSGQSLICGGSCLSPPEHVRPDSQFNFQGRACDVGFRVVVPAR